MGSMRFALLASTIAVGGLCLLLGREVDALRSARPRGSERPRAARRGSSVWRWVLAACPLVATLLDFRLDVPCAWFSIDAEAEPQDVEVVVPLDPGRRNACTAERGVRGPLAEDEVADVFLDQARPMPLELAQERLHEVRRGNRQVGFSPFAFSYRPMTIIVPLGHGAPVA